MKKFLIAVAIISTVGLGVWIPSAHAQDENIDDFLKKVGEIQDTIDKIEKEYEEYNSGPKPPYSGKEEPEEFDPTDISGEKKKALERESLASMHRAMIFALSGDPADFFEKPLYGPWQNPADYLEQEKKEAEAEYEKYFKEMSPEELEEYKRDLEYLKKKILEAYKAE